MQPRPEDYDFELDTALDAVVGVKTRIPSDAFTADTLGTERVGHGVVIREDGVVLTIGYLVTEAETVWLSLPGGRTAQGHVLGYDQETGFGLVQALARLDIEPLRLGNSGKAAIGEHVVVAGGGGRQKAVAARIVAKQEFAGYWEYVLDEAIFTAPAHPHWGGTALIGPAGDLLGIGSLHVQHGGEDDAVRDLNMIVPIDLLKPILPDLSTIGRTRKPPRPWLGLFATEVGGRVVVAGLAKRGPASGADLKVADVILAVAGKEVLTLAQMFRLVWSLGEAGVEVPIRVNRGGRTFDVLIKSTDRRKMLKGPILH